MHGFVDGDYLRPKLLCQRHGIVDVIEVSVRNQYRVDSFDLMVGGVGGVALGPGVHQENITRAEAKLKRAMSKPGDFEHYVSF